MLEPQNPATVQYLVLYLMGGTCWYCMFALEYQVPSFQGNALSSANYWPFNLGKNGTCIIFFDVGRYLHHLSIHASLDSFALPELELFPSAFQDGIHVSNYLRLQ